MALHFPEFLLKKNAEMQQQINVQQNTVYLKQQIALKILPERYLLPLGHL